MVVAVAVAVGVGVRELYLPGKPVQDGPITSVVSVALSQQPGSPIVRMSPDAAAHPDAVAVRGLLQLFFDSINQRSYERWKTAVTRDRVRMTSESQWRSEYDTTRDGSIVVYRIEPGPDDALLVLLSLTSTQDEDKAPAEAKASCLHWRLVYHVVRDNGALRLDFGPAPILQVQQC